MLPLIDVRLLMIGYYHGVNRLYYLRISIFYLMRSFLSFMDCFVRVLTPNIGKLEFLHEIVRLSKTDGVFLTNELY
jgi:hypothetical protein